MPYSMPTGEYATSEYERESVAFGNPSDKSVSASSDARTAGRFTILHTNDLHSSLIGMSPASDYSPLSPHHDTTRGGFSRLSALISSRKACKSADGPVLVLDAGDYSMGTAFGAASREIGAELVLLAQMGYDATTFGNHDFDLGPDGLGRSIEVAAQSGRIPALVAANSDFSSEDAKLDSLRNLERKGLIRRYVVIERAGLRFGVFGLLGKEAVFYTAGAGSTKFADPIETAHEMVRLLRGQERVDVVVCLSHCGLDQGVDGHFVDGEDVVLAREVPGIDVVIGGHTHNELREPILVNGRVPVVQAGKYGENLGELTMKIGDDGLLVESYTLHPIDDSILGDVAIEDAITKVKVRVSEAVFASRGYRIDQPLAVVPRDLPNNFTDIEAGTVLANLVTDSFRRATNADIGFTVNGMMRSPLTRGKTGVQTVYDVFAVAPLGDGIVDTTAGSALVTAYFTGAELKAILEFCLVDSPAHPGEYFPRSSGMRYTFDRSCSAFNQVVSIEIGDLQQGYRQIDISGTDDRLFSLTCPLYLGLFIVAIPKFTKGQLVLVPKNKLGEHLQSRSEALAAPRGSTPDLLPPRGLLDLESLALSRDSGTVREIKEWQAIMDFLGSLPSDNGELPMVPVEGDAAEVRAIQVH